MQVSTYIRKTIYMIFFKVIITFKVNKTFKEVKI